MTKASLVSKEQHLKGIKMGVYAEQIGKPLSPTWTMHVCRAPGNFGTTTYAGQQQQRKESLRRVWARTPFSPDAALA